MPYFLGRTLYECAVLHSVAVEAGILSALGTKFGFEHEFEYAPECAHFHAQLCIPIQQRGRRVSANETREAARFCSATFVLCKFAATTKHAKANEQSPAFR